MTYKCNYCVDGFDYLGNKCRYCETGQVTDRRQSQRRKQGRRDGDYESMLYYKKTVATQMMLKEAVELLRRVERDTQWYAAVDAFLEKIK